MMVTADVALLEFRMDVVLHHRRATKFTAPDNQRFVQQASLIQILDQSRNRTI